MTNLLTSSNTHTICDLQGAPLHPDSVTLIKALDKLLTVGTYYSADHDQYLEAATRSCADIVGVIGGESRNKTIEITAHGMMIGGQKIDPRHRNVRLLHDLLVPLNIARLEIHGSLTRDHLCQAVSVLQGHRMTLGKTNFFREIIFDGMPASVQVASCNVQLKLEDELDEDSTGNGSTEHLVRRFMDMVTKILESFEKFDRESGVRVKDVETGSYVSKAELVELKSALQKLVEADPDPEELTKLITQAQHALDLSNDARSVNLIFSILKKDILKKEREKAPENSNKSRTVEFKLTVDELFRSIVTLETSDAVIEEPLSGSRNNHLAIMLYLLRSDSPWALRTGIVTAIENALVHPDFSSDDLFLFSRTIDTIVREEEIKDIDELVPLVTSVLREKRSEMISQLWTSLIDLSDAEHLVKLWPHLINDILLGLDAASPEEKTTLTLAAGSLPMFVAKSQGGRLEGQPALNGARLSRDIFSAPLKKMHPVLAVLMATELREWLGGELFRTLRRRPGSPVVESVVAALGEHHPELGSFYLGLIMLGDNPELPARIRTTVIKILHGKLSEAKTGALQASWIPQGLIELGKLDPAGARPLFERILKEKKYLFFKVWPASAREAAATALRDGRGEVE